MQLKTVNGEEVYSAIDVRAELKISAFIMKRRVLSGEIPAIRGGDKKLYIPKVIAEKYIEEKKSISDFKSYICEILESYGLNADVVRISRYFKTYLKGYDYFGMTMIPTPVYAYEQAHNFYFLKNERYILDANIKEKIILKESTPDQCISYFLKDERIISKPILKKTVEEYIKDILPREKASCAEMINFLRCTLDKELANYNNDEISKYIEKSEEEITKNARTHLVKLYDKMRKTIKCDSDLIFKIDNEKVETTRDVRPYTIQTYLKISYMVFNEEYWKEHNMIEKAVENIMLARVWLYHAMHFVCGWRSGDIQKKLPRVMLADKPETTLKKIKNAEYDEEEYRKISKQMIDILKYVTMKPSKTEKHETTPLLRINIEESWLPVIGMLVMICEAHNQKISCKESLINGVIRYENCVKLFGEEYGVILNGNVLSNRKANKSYLTLLSDSGEEIETDGYLIAAYARSHTSGINNISDMTERYLEAKMNGYSKDDISRTLFERGVCSFVPYTLLAVLENEQFKKISITEQTEQIKALSCTPNQIEGLLETNDRMRKLIKDRINEIITSAPGENLEEYIRKILENIGRGACPGKTEGILCLRKALRKDCNQKTRETCIGCTYEIYVKSMLDELRDEIFFQQEKFDAAITDAEKIKRNAILNERLYPTAYEILYVMKNVYKQDIKEYKKIFMEETKEIGNE